MENLDRLQNQIINYLESPNTHRSLEDAVKEFPENLINEKPNGVPYTFWQLLEHIRISQYDMIDFIQNPKYKEMEWPKEYWPAENIKATKEMWRDSIIKYHKDLDTLISIVKKNMDNILVPIPHGDGQTIFREVMQIIDHASYHLGEFILMRRICNAWKY